MRWSVVFFIIGITNMLLGSLMFIPMTVDYITHNTASADTFMACGLSTIFVGLALSSFSHHSAEHHPSLREMFVITSFIWFSSAIFSALPFYFSSLKISLTDSIFESVSGLSTTGSTVLGNLSTFPKGLLVWRGMIQWLGGVGIVILAITLLPFLHIGGMQLFATENSDRSGKDSAFVASKMKSILGVYLIISILCFISLYLAGMGIFDALVHAMTCVSTGGFSNYDDSIAHFTSPAIHWVLITFMLIGGLPLLFTWSFLTRNWQKIKSERQAHTFLCFLACLILSISVIFFFVRSAFPTFEETLRQTAFATISIITTTGYVLSDYTHWGSFFVVFFFFLTCVGSCTGSTSGGIKFFRFSILFKMLKKHLSLMLTPHAVIVPRYNDRPVTDEIIQSVISFMSLFCLTTLFCSLVLATAGADFVTSLSASLTAIANVGPGIGSVVGPDKTFATLPDVSKWALALTMMLGRLEFMTIIVLLLPQLWRKK